MKGNFGKNQRRVIDYLEEHREAFREEIVKALADPDKKYLSERSKINDSILRLIDDNVLFVGSEFKNLLAMTDRDYRFKFPKAKVVRINKEHPRYKQYRIWKKSKF